MAAPLTPWFSWLEQRRRLLFGWLLALAFLIQNFGIWVAWQAHSPLQTLLGVLGGGCTLYLLLSNRRQAISMTTAYRVGAGVLAARLLVEIAAAFVNAQPLTTAQYLEASMLVTFLVTVLPTRTSALLTGLLLSLLLALVAQGGGQQIIEFLLLLVNAGALHFTAQYGRQTYHARRRIEELERQMVWDPLTGIANRPLIEERTRTFMLSPGRDSHLAVTVTVGDRTPSLSAEGRSALQYIVKNTRPLLRDGDSIGRWSEHTLLLLFHQVTPAQRPALLGHLNAALQDLQRGGLVPMNMYLGSAALNEALTPEDIVKKARNQRLTVGPWMTCSTSFPDGWRGLT